LRAGFILDKMFWTCSSIGAESPDLERKIAMFNGCVFGFPEGFGVSFQIAESHLIPSRSQIASGVISVETTVKWAVDLSAISVITVVMGLRQHTHILESLFHRIR